MLRVNCTNSLFVPRLSDKTQSGLHFHRAKYTHLTSDLHNKWLRLNGHDFIFLWRCPAGCPRSRSLHRLLQQAGAQNITKGCSRRFRITEVRESWVGIIEQVGKIFWDNEFNITASDTEYFHLKNILLFLHIHNEKNLFWSCFPPSSVFSSFLCFFSLF